jgi:hypothetical protein
VSKRLLHSDRLELVETMCELLEKGLPLTAVCQRVGISTTLVQHWRRWARGADGQPPKEEYIELVRRLSLSQAKSAETLIDRMLTAAEEGDVTALKWLLSRLHPQWFGSAAAQERIEVEATVEQGETEDQRIVRGYTAPERLRALAEIAKELGLGREPVRTAPQAPAPPVSQVQRAADALRGALAFGPRPVKETAQRIAEELGCEPQTVWDAADLLNLEQELSPGSRPMWKLPADPKRTTPNVEARTTDEGRPADPSVASGIQAVQGVGDFLRRRR